MKPLPPHMARRIEIGDRIGHATVLSVTRAKLPTPTGKADKGKAEPSKLAAKFEGIWRVFGDPAYRMVPEFRFHETRKWRFDFAFPDQSVAVEIDGGVHSGGRHTRGKGFEADCDKLNAAASAGWHVLRLTASHLTKARQVETVDLVKETLAERL